MGHDLVRIGAVLKHKKRGVTARYIQTTKDSIKKTSEDIEYEVLRKFDRRQLMRICTNNVSQCVTQWGQGSVVHHRGEVQGQLDATQREGDTQEKADGC